MRKKISKEKAFELQNTAWGGGEIIGHANAYIYIYIHAMHLCHVHVLETSIIFVGERESEREKR